MRKPFGTNFSVSNRYPIEASKRFRILAPIIGGALLQQYGTSAPGVFAALVMTGVFFYVMAKIYNHPIVATRQSVTSD